MDEMQQEISQEKRSGFAAVFIAVFLGTAIVV